MKKQTKTSSRPVEKQMANEQGMPLAKAKGMLAIVLAAVAFLLYANTLNHDYTVDDGTVMQNNKITKQGIKAIPKIFTTAYRKGFWDRQESLYRPLSVAMFAVEWQLFPNNPQPGHLINVLLYALSAFVLFHTLLLLFKNNIVIAFAISLLYIAHPLHTEVVANIKSRDEILCLLFMLLSVKFFIENADVKKISTAVLSAFCFLLSLLSKESAITCVAIFPLLLFFFRNKNLKESLAASIIPWGAAAVYLLIRFAVLKGLSNFTEILPINNSIVNATSFADKFATAVMIMGKYLYLLLIPHPLSFDYSFNQIPVVGLSNGMALLSLIIYVALIVYAIKEVKNRNGVAFGILFFLITISVVSNVFFLIESVMAERFTFMPSLGICIALVLALSKWLKTESRISDKVNYAKLFKSNKGFFLIIFTIAFLYSVKTVSRNTDWKNNLTLLAKDVKTCPESARIRYAYGSAILIEQALVEKDESKKQMLLDKSIVQLERGVAILPTYAEAFYHLGLAYKEKSDFPRAVQNFENASKHKTFTDPSFFVAWGVACGKAKMYPQSIKALNHAIDLNPKQADAYTNLGVFYDEMNKFDESVKALSKAIELDSVPDGAYYNLGNTYAHVQRFGDAVNYYKKALEINPKNEDAVNNTGNSYAAMQDYPNAIIYFKKAIEMNPNNAKALNNLGITLIMTGKKEDGELFVAKAKQLSQ